MIKRAPFLVLLILLTVGFAASAHAQDPGDCGGEGQRACTPTFEPLPMGNGPTITACTAQTIQQCQDCKQVFTSTGGTYMWECRGVRRNASCECSRGTRDGCSVNGTCTYEGFW